MKAEKFDEFLELRGFKCLKNISFFQTDNQKRKEIKQKRQQRLNFGTRNRN